MRLRRIPGTKQEIRKYPQWLVLDPGSFNNCWRGYFAERMQENPLSNTKKEIHLELGVGRGTFINTMAKQRPDVYWIGAELREEVLLDAIQKASVWQAPNLAFLWINIEQTVDIFGKGEVDHIYINFPDPWPKERHGKRRLTHRRFLERYRRFLKPKGEIHFKTDNRELFDFSLQEFNTHGFRLERVTYDLHHDPEKEAMGLSANVMTEYERRFTTSGMPIHRCVAILERSKSETKETTGVEDL